MILTFLTAAPLAASPNQPRTVAVDCDKGQTIAAALDKSSDELVIEIEGVCVENVVLRRDRTTLQGVAPGAAIEGDGPPTVLFGGTISVDGASRVKIADLEVRGGDRRGIAVLQGGAATLERVYVHDVPSSGISVLQGSSVRLDDVTVERSGAFGLSVFDNSSVEVFGGPSRFNDNPVVGALISTGSGLQGGGQGALLETDGNGIFGLVLQIGAAAQIDLAARNNPIGLWLVDNATFAGDVELRDNFSLAALVNSGSMLDANGTIADNGFGIFADGDSTLLLNVQISGHPFTGLAIDGSTAQIGSSSNSDATILLFGTRADFTGGNNFTGPVNCDGTELVRGDVSCSAPAALRSPSPSATKSAPEVPTEPFTLDP